MGGTKIKKHEASAEEPTQIEPGEVSTEEKVSKKVKKHILGKKYSETRKLVDRSIDYSLSDAIKLAKKTVYTKFTPSLEVHVNLNTDTKHSSQGIRTTINLPHNTGKTITIIAFGSGTDYKAIEEAGAVKGTEALLSEFGSGKVTVGSDQITLDSHKFKIIATAEWMPKLAKAAKILGPKGLMPNPKSRTVATSLAETLRDFKGGMIEIKSQEGQPVVHAVAGRMNMEEAHLEENVAQIVRSVANSQPAGLKKALIKSVFVATTMGPSIKINLSSIINL